MAAPALTIRRVRRSDIAALDALLQLYQYEFSSMLDVHPDRAGRFRFVRIHGADRRNFLIRVRGRLAGFVSIRLGRLDQRVRGAEVEEFFVLRRHRRRGVGRRAAREILRRFPGHWRVMELRSNRPAIRFWRGVIRGVAVGRRFCERRSAWVVTQCFRTGESS